MAEEFNHIDQIIRRKFEDFEPEPPAQVWENIKSGISKTPPPPASPGILLPIIVTVSLLIFVAGLFHHLYNGNPENQFAYESGAVSIHSASLGTTGSTTASDNTLQEEFYNTPSTASPVEPEPGNEAKPAVSPIPVRAPFEQKTAIDRKKRNSKTDSQSIPTNAARSGQWKPGLVQSLKAGELTYSDALIYNLSPRDVRKLASYREYSRTKIADWSVGLYFNPEVASSQDESIDNTINFNIGLMPRVTINNFFIQSGINARFTHDKGNMAVDYNRYLGSYEDVYLVTFDSTDNGIIPTYYTQTVEVYDTVTHYSVSETRANYTYLEIPLLFGYHYSFGKFSMFANAGPAASFIVNKNIPDAAFPEDKAKIINVDYQVPLRNTINWQLLLGAGFDYRLASNISFSLEPTFRFGLNQEYDVQQGRTRAFGIRAGLNYKF